MMEYAKKLTPMLEMIDSCLPLQTLLYKYNKVQIIRLDKLTTTAITLIVELDNQ